METKRRSRSNHTVCRKHPKHRQSPGVCSVCLTEKLSKLSTSGTSRTNTVTSSCSSSSLSSLSSLSSSELSSYSSPVHRHFRAKIGLMKSKSMAFVARRRGGGFWSKLLGQRSEKRVDDGFMHSRTMRETRIVH